MDWIGLWEKEVKKDVKVFGLSSWNARIAIY